jgi:carbonic anhydrase
MVMSLFSFRLRRLTPDEPPLPLRRRAVALAWALGLLALTAGPVLAQSTAAERLPANVDKRQVPIRGGGASDAASDAATADALTRLQNRLAERLNARAAGASGAPAVVRIDNAGPGDVVLRAGAATGSAAAAAGSKVRPGGAGGAGSSGARAGAHKASLPHWSYAGADGPEVWGRLHPSYAACGNGRRQSPIDIREGIAVDLPEIQFDYRSGFFSVVDNGHAIEVRTAPGSRIEVGTRSFELQGLHFHHPSEEVIDGRRFALSIHLVHKDAQGRLAVVALLGETDADDAEQPVVQQVWNHLPLERGEPAAAPVELDLPRLLPAGRGYATYMGSLTTPPCTEGVLWMVMQSTLKISKAQLAILARLYPMNARPVQPTNGRLIKQSR